MARFHQTAFSTLFYASNSAVLKPHQWPIKHSPWVCHLSSPPLCAVFLLCCLSAAYFHHPFTLTLSSTSVFMMNSEGLRRELAGRSADDGRSIGDAAEAHGTNWHPQRLGNFAPCHYHNCTYFWRPQQLRDPNDGEPSNLANWPRLLITNWVCTACPKHLWNVRPMKWASVGRDLGE